MLYKIKHYRTTKLHQRAHKTTKQTKHGNLYNDLANFQKSCFLLLFFKVDLSLYEFPCFVFLVIWGKGPCNFIIQSCLILCNTTKNWQKSQLRYFEQFRAISRLFGANSVLVSIVSEFVVNCTIKETVPGKSKQYSPLPHHQTPCSHKRRHSVHKQPWHATTSHSHHLIVLINEKIT